MTHHNGQVPEPPEPGLVPFTFPDSGRTVFVRKVSPLLIGELRKAFPPPTPPMNPVDYGDGKAVEEPNKADPDYQRSLDEYNVEFEEKARRLYIRRGVLVQMDEAKRAEVAQLREDMRELAAGQELDPDDRFVYVSYICIGTREDYQALVGAVMRRSQPTEAAIAETVESFPAAVPGS